ncbi:MAG: hypothetical protein AB7K24_17555 [Gemmataceae bacterium]
MADPAKLPNLWKNLDHFQSVINKVHESLSNPEQKRALGELLGKLQEARTEAEKVVPDLVNGLQQKNEALKSWAEEFLGKIAEKQRELEGLKAAAKQKPPRTTPRPAGPVRRTEDIPVEAVPGEALRDEILQQLSGAAQPAASTGKDREIWEDLSILDRKKVDVAPDKGPFRSADHAISHQDIEQLARRFLKELDTRQQSGDWTNW